MKRVSHVASLALAALLTGGGCGPSIYERFDYAREPDPRRREYVIGPADVVHIGVYHLPDLSGQGTVRPDGVLTMPLVGDLQVAGKTPTQVRDEMKAKLAGFVKADTVINVTVTGFNSYRFVVTGNVMRSGAVQPKYFVTISEALAMAGGPSKFAGDQVIIYRTDESRKVHEIPVSYKALLSGKHPEQDICVLAGDSIVMP
jgi:polysaccharide export outer membrane protein